VVWASLLKEFLEVVRGRPWLTLATASNNHGVYHDGAAFLLVDATVVIGRCYGLLVVLLAPLPATLGVLLGILDDDIG
jgi:hypothetical protein